jgi:hypothetical protein
MRFVLGLHVPHSVVSAREFSIFWNASYGSVVTVSDFDIILFRINDSWRVPECGFHLAALVAVQRYASTSGNKIASAYRICGGNYIL